MRFMRRFLQHHFMDQSDLAWLEQFDDLALSTEEQEVFSVVRSKMSKDWNTKVTKAHEIHERKLRRPADFRAFRGLSQLS